MTAISKASAQPVSSPHPSSKKRMEAESKSLLSLVTFNEQVEGHTNIPRSSVLFLHYHKLPALSWLMITSNKVKKPKIPFSNNLTAAQNRIHQLGSCSTGDEVARQLHDHRLSLKFAWLNRKLSSNPLSLIHIDGWSADAFKTHRSLSHLVSWLTILKPQGSTQLYSVTFSNHCKIFERKQTSRWTNETDGLLKFLFIWSLLRT